MDNLGGRTIIMTVSTFTMTISVSFYEAASIAAQIYFMTQQLHSVNVKVGINFLLAELRSKHE